MISNTTKWYFSPYQSSVSDFETVANYMDNYDVKIWTNKI